MDYRRKDTMLEPLLPKQFSDAASFCVGLNWG